MNAIVSSLLKCSNADLDTSTSGTIALIDDGVALLHATRTFKVYTSWTHSGVFDWVVPLTRCVQYTTTHVSCSFTYAGPLRGITLRLSLTARSLLTPTTPLSLSIESLRVGRSVARDYDGGTELPLCKGCWTPHRPVLTRTIDAAEHLL